jgi:hypothetical protein
LDFVLEALKLAIPTIIALASLIYAIKQRNIVKKEIAKKRYLENAQINLNEAIQRLRNVNLPRLQDQNCDIRESIPDEYNDANMIANDLLQAYFESKTTRFTLKVTYWLTDLGDLDKEYSKREIKDISDFSKSSPKLLIDLLKANKSFWIHSETDILEIQRQFGNSIGFHPITWGIESLWFAIKKLSMYEEVYDTVCPNIVKRVNNLLDEIAEDVFRVISEPKTIEIDLKEFSKTDDIIKHLIDRYLTYIAISEKLSQGISELDSKLTEARKELFLKIS